MSKILSTAVLIASSFGAIHAAEPSAATVTTATVETATAATIDSISPAMATLDSIVTVVVDSLNGRRRPQVASEKPRIKTKFTWGADAGASIDMSGNDMSTIDFNAYFGLSHGWLNFLGLGVEADIMVNNSCRSFPIFMQFRTNFVNRPTILFWDLRVGASLNYLEHNHQQTAPYAGTGIGFYLARGEKFSSHIVIGYTFRQRKEIVGSEMTHDFHDLHYASVKIGVTF